MNGFYFVNNVSFGKSLFDSNEFWHVPASHSQQQGSKYNNKISGHFQSITCDFISLPARLNVYPLEK